MTTQRSWFLTLLVAMTVLGAAIRWASPGRGALWRDEAQFLAIAEMPSAGAVYRYLADHESHPPFYYWLGHALGRLTGRIAPVMAALSLLASVAAIPAAGLLARRLFSPTAGIAAAALVATSLPIALFSVQIRPYAVLTLLWMTSAGAFVVLWREPSRRWLAAWVVASALALWIHHTTIVFLAAELAAVSFLAGGRHRPASPRTLAIGAAAIAVLWIPLGPLFLAQVGTSSYPSVTPMELSTPWRQLASLMLQYPLELLLPVAALATLGVARRSVRDDARAWPAIAVAVAFLGVATLATYRSQLLVPHLLMAFAPVGLVAAGGVLAQLLADGRRLAGAVLAEAAVLLAVLSALFGRGVVKSNTREIAEQLGANAAVSDLVLVSPGYVGVSFNRYFEGPQSQINFPVVGRQLVQPFDHHFERFADTAALRAVTDSVDAAARAGRSVWLVAPLRWLRDDVPTPDVLRADSFGGLSQAERSRTNYLHRYLVRVSGEPSWQIADSSPGMEVLTLLQFTPRAPRSR